TTEIVRLATESRALLKDIRSRENISYDERSRGILHFYRDKREFEAAIPVANLMRKYGCNRRVIDAAETVKIEPAFETRRTSIVGATYTEEDESGDAMKYTQALAHVCASMGVTFLYGSEVVSLDVERNKGQVVSVQARTPKGYVSISGHDVVVSLGSYSAPFLREYGISLCI